MRDISARELKGHNILAVERFQDSTRSIFGICIPIYIKQTFFWK